MFIITFTSFQEYSPLLFYDMHTRGVYTYEGRPAFFTLAHSDADFAHIAASLKEAVADAAERRPLLRRTGPEAGRASRDRAHGEPAGDLDRDPVRR